jgi:hypothetical protein
VQLDGALEEAMINLRKLSGYWRLPRSFARERQWQRTTKR